MRKTNKLLVTLLIAGIILQSIPVYASNYKDILKENQSLKSEEAALKKEESELSESITEIKRNLKVTDQKLKEKQNEIAEIRVDLKKAREAEQKQQEDMKLRIKYMYENEPDLFETFVESQSMSDFLANTEYIKQISAYDREMLLKFETTRKEIEKCEAELKKEEKKLIFTKEDLYTEQIKLSNLLEENKEKLKTVSKKLQDTIVELNKIMNTSGEPAPWIVEGAGVLANPCPAARISSEFGPRKAPVPGASTYHKGRDYAAPSGTSIVAAADGVVTTVQTNSVRGYYLIIKHPNGLSTWYQHCTDIFVSPGTKVAAGQTIATVGATGRVSGPHLHFIVQESNGKEVDPRKYL